VGCSELAEPVLGTLPILVLETIEIRPVDLHFASSSRRRGWVSGPRGWAERLAHRVPPPAA
jgi:hypothetical protein